MRRGILGGTFDPPHFGHLLAGEAAYRDLELDVVSYFPTGDPWQKADRRIGAPHHRFEMLRRAIGGVGYFDIDDRELRREGPTYTIDTLEELEDSEDELTLVMGADSAQGFQTWHRWEEITGHAALAVAPRQGVTPDDVRSVLPSDPAWLDMAEVSLSGTDMRARVKAGRSIRFMTPDPVWEYVEEYEL
ncbi:MAG: nicotinate-nucleotide adenylyltransferase, partial [Acidimicrobiia bacterium]